MATIQEFVRRYAQLHTIGTMQEDAVAELMGAISILGFASLNDIEDHIIGADHEAIFAAEASLLSDGSEVRTGELQRPQPVSCRN